MAFTMQRLLLCSVSAAAVSVAAAPIYAGSPQTGELRHSTAVHFSSSSFERPRDVAKLYSRIAYAADQVCGPRALTGFHYTSPGYSSCYAHAVAQAIARVDEPQLTAYYQEQLTRDSRNLALDLK
ncbi:MAG TPA: UrcA family protein [Steroidobacteraceae bacterium]